MKAWHFVGETLRGGAPVPQDGEKLIHTGHLRMCESGLHASKDVLDALKYAPGPTLCRVALSGLILESKDKLVASERTILWRRPVEAELRGFARGCALSVAHCWVMPPVVREYLESGSEAFREEARYAAWAAARDPARDAVWEEARYAAWAAARDPAWATAWDVAQAAAGAAARATAWDVAQAAAKEGVWAKTRAAQSLKLEALLVVHPECSI
ncbi:MAG: DUF7666 domain-containing protein [Nitrososphaera sp.]